MNFTELNRRMDQSVEALRDAFVHEQQEAMLLQLSARMVEKLADRDRRIKELEGEVEYLENRLMQYELGESDE